MKVVWSAQALNGLQKVIKYLEDEWTETEVEKFEKRIERVINQLKQQPEMFPASYKKPNLRKALVDKNNYMVYRWNPAEKRIFIIIFRGTRQKPVL